jgi:flagellar protein FlbD
VIPVHRLTHPESPIWLNPDLIQLIEQTPDTVVSLTNGTRLVVDEEPAEILELVRTWRAAVIATAARPDLLEQPGLKSVP